MFTDLSASAFWLLASVMIGILLRLIQAKWAKDRATLFQLARWILIPYLALLSGHLSPRFMGLVGLNWPATFGAGMGIGLVILMLTAVAKVTNIQHPFSQSVPYSTDGKSSWPMSTVPTASHFGGLLLRALAQAFHWAFIRAAIWEILIHLPISNDNPIYPAVWLATIVIAIEALPAMLRNGRQWLTQMALLVLTSVLFLYTQNFYLCAILHFTILLILNAEE